MPETKTYSGGCHCGQVKYEVSTALEPVISCNCSICTKRGSLLTFVPSSQFKLRSGEGELGDYQWNKHIIHHLFCKTCGILSFARGRTPKGEEIVAINVRCLDGVDLAKLKVTPFDGRSL